MHLYRQLPSPPHRDALAGFVESVTGVREARPAHAPTLLVPAPTFPAADKATAKRLAKQPPGRLRKAAAKTCRFDALVQAPSSTPPCYRPLRFAVAAPEPAKRWWQRLLARTPPATVATDDEWFCRLVEPHVVAALAQDEAAVTVDGPAPARTTYTVQALDAVGGGVTVEVVVRNPNVPWFAFAERVAAEVAAAAAETVAEPGVATGDTTGARRSSRASSAAAAAVSQPKAEGGSSEQVDVQGGAAASEAASPRPVCLYAVDTTGRPRPWSLTGTLLTHPVPEPATTLRWAYADAGREAGRAMTAAHHQQGGVLLFLFSLLVALLYIAQHVPVVAHALAAIYSHRHLFATGATHVVQGVTYVYHHVSPFAGTVVHGVETGAKDVVRVGKAVTQTVAPVVNKAVAATKAAAHHAAPVVQTGAHTVGHAAKAVAHEGEVVGKAVAKEAKVVGKAIAKGATAAAQAVDKEAKAVVATVKAHTKGVGGASASAKKAAARKAFRGATLVPLTVLPDDTADAPPAPATTRYFGLLVKRRSHWTCAAVLAMPATAFVGYPPDFYLGQHLLRLTKLVNTVMAGSYAAFCTEAVARLPPAERGPVLRELGRAGKRIRAVVRKHKLPTPLPTLSSPQQLLYEACCHPASKKQSADCKGYKALYHDTLKRSGWLTRKGELRCEAVRPRRTRRRVG